MASLWIEDPMALRQVVISINGLRCLHDEIQYITQFSLGRVTQKSLRVDAHGFLGK